MTFTAQLRKFSRVWRHWREGNRVGGVLHGAQFFWEPGNLYRSKELEPAQLEALRSHPDVDIEAIGTALPTAPLRAPAPFVAPSPPPVGVSQPRRR